HGKPDEKHREVGARLSVKEPDHHDSNSPVTEVHRIAEVAEETVYLHHPWRQRLWVEPHQGYHRECRDDQGAVQAIDPWTAGNVLRQPDVQPPDGRRRHGRPGSPDDWQTVADVIDQAPEAESQRAGRDEGVPFHERRSHG